MPAVSTSPASSVRTRCTDTIAIYEVRGLEITSTAALTALHCSTTRGIVEILLPTWLFVDRCRGERDRNGRPLGVVAVAKELRQRQEKLRRELEQDAAASREELAALRGQPTATVAAERAFTPAAILEEGAQRRTRDTEERETSETTASSDSPASSPSPGLPASSALATLEPLPEKRDYIGRERALRAAWELFIATPDLTVWAIAERLGCRASYLRNMFDLYASDPAAPVLNPNGKLR